MRHRCAAALAVLVVVLGATSESFSGRTLSAPSPAPPAWLARLNFYRTLAGLPPVKPSAAWNNGGRLHSRYVVKNEVVDHAEDPANPWYTPQGDAAGMNGNVMGRFEIETTDSFAIDDFMDGPFHAVGMIDPRYLKAGFGSYREAGPALQMAATLDTNRGRGLVPPSVEYPVVWPNASARVPLRSFVSEYPDPLTSCAGYAAPAGLPVYLLVGSGDRTPRVTAHSFKKGAASLAHCVFHEGNYRNPDPALQTLGRAILGARDAVVLIPKAPLERGARYTVSITANGTKTTWSFTVSNKAP